MTTAELVAGPRPTLSFELYAPRTEAGVATLPRTVAELAALRPDFFSITYGATSPTRETSGALVRHILATTDVPALAHLTCVGATRAELEATVRAFVGDGVRDILALRGDPPHGAWEPPPGGVARSSDLVALVAALDPDVSIAVAASPATTRTADGRSAVAPADVAALLAKEEAGAHYAITQLFFEADHYAAFVAAARAAGARLPILPGLVVTDDPHRLAWLSRLTGVPVPRDLLAGLEAAEGAARRHLAARRAADLVAAALDLGAPGVHLYTLNDAGPVAYLLDRPPLRALSERAPAPRG